MSSRDRLEVLRATKELGGYTDPQLRRLLPFVDEACVPAGIVIAEAGRLCHQLVIVASGVLETCREGRSGRLGPGDVFGWSAMRDRGVYNANVFNYTGSLNATATWDAMIIGTNVLTKHLPVALDLLSDIVLHATFPEEELERMRLQRLAAIEAQRGPLAVLSR